MPGESLVLQVFEPRYLTMVADLTGDEFGVVLIRSGSEVGGGADYFEVGTVAHIRDRRDTVDGRVFLAVAGDRTFRIIRHLDRQPYPEAMVTDFAATNSSPTELRDEVVALFRRYAATLSEGGFTSDVMAEIPIEPEAASFAVASRMRLAAPELQELLEADSTTQRLERQKMILAKEIDLLRNIWGSNE